MWCVEGGIGIFEVLFFVVFVVKNYKRMFRCFVWFR